MMPVGCIRELLRQHKVGPDARWSKTKEALAADDRYKALPRDDRERLFRAYVAEQEVCSFAHSPSFPPLPLWS